MLLVTVSLLHHTNTKLIIFLQQHDAKCFIIITYLLHWKDVLINRYFPSFVLHETEKKEEASLHQSVSE